MLSGEQIYKMAEELFPICRSITGDGVRETFRILQKHVPELMVYEVPTGTNVFDWTVPRESMIPTVVQTQKSAGILMTFLIRFAIYGH